LPRDPRIASAVVLDHDGFPRILKGRYVRAGQSVTIGHAEEGSEGIYVHASGFWGGDELGPDGESKFMYTDVSREKPTDYAEMARILADEKERGGYVVWVLGPAVLHSRGRDVMQCFIENGYVHAMLGGNAVAVHDIEAAVLGTTLGMNNRGSP